MRVSLHIFVAVKLLQNQQTVAKDMKNIRKIRFLVALCILVMGGAASAAVSQRPIHDHWRFRQGNSELWHPAQVPGNTHLDLMRERIIEDPFFRLNERSVQWVDKEDWMYETRLTPTAEELKAAHQTLVFKGLDTYADVYLNHQRILEADNMHREWRCDVRGILKEGENLLEVYFHSPIKRNVPKFDALPYRHNTGPDHSQMGGIFDKAISPFARTAGFEYGWDWGPRLVTFGIWRPVLLETWSGLRIADVWYIQKDVTPKRALLRTVVEVESDEAVPHADITITADGDPVAKKVASLTSGLNQITLDYEIKHPHLWWTNGLGEPYLTTMVAAVTPRRERPGDGSAGGESVTTPLGIRSLRLHNDPDQWGHNLYFELNGEPLFAKGSNMIPNDNFLSRVTDSIYRQVVADAAAVNMNIIRVWGGGIYEDDAFYRYCDQMGILVWQDFMFACTTYEVDSAFLENIRQEAICNVRRLRNHACMAVYTGNNEAQDVWFGWGGKKRYFDEMGQGERVWKMQHQIFYEVLPEVVKEYAGGTAYRPSSPWAFEDTPSDGVNGDDHYWGVWHGGDPIEAYFDHHVRFESEYGFQSFPEYESVLLYNPDPRDHNIYSEVMMAHQNAGTYANHRIEEYMSRDYRVPTAKDSTPEARERAFKNFLYVGQVLQADAVKMGMEAFRRDRPYCMGTIVWQLNDCWPVASWSSRDYYGRWKALHYVTRAAYDDILVSPRVKDADAQAQENVQVAALPGQEDGGVKSSKDVALSKKVLELKLVNDRRTAVSGTLKIETMTLDGRIVYEQTQKVGIPKNDAIDVKTWRVEDILGGEQPCDVIFYITYTTGGKTYSNIAYPLRQKDMHYRPARIAVTSLRPVAGGFSLSLKSDIFARAVFLKTKGIRDFFSDNYFDLLPGEERTLTVRTIKPLSVFKQELEITSLGNTY